METVFGFGNLPSSMSEAIKLGVTYFFTGKACKNGHVQPRYTKGGRCYWCTRENQATRLGQTFTARTSKRLARATRDAASKNSAMFYVPTKPCKNGHSKRFSSSGNCVECFIISKERRKDKAKVSRIKAQYGLSEDQHTALYNKQEMSCAICRVAHPNKFSMHVDHCHRTGKVRGLLCQKCNQAIGLLRDDQMIIAAALEYVK